LPKWNYHQWRRESRWIINGYVVFKCLNTSLLQTGVGALGETPLPLSTATFLSWICFHINWEKRLFYQFFFFLYYCTCTFLTRFSSLPSELRYALPTSTAIQKKSAIHGLDWTNLCRRGLRYTELILLFKYVHS
jgi:hypothetical protein